MPLSRIPRPIPIWIPPEEIPSDVDLESIHHHRLISSLLWRRGIRSADDAAEFMDQRGPESLDPYILPNMAEAIARTTTALRNHEQIGIFGDYDADGVTSTTLLYRALASVTGSEHVTAFVPDRSDGYGVSPRGVNLLADQGATLMIAVDCGSNDTAAVALAQSRGMNVIILDHHAVTCHGPESAILVSPQLHPDGRYTELTGAGVAWLFIQALAAGGFPVSRMDDDDPCRALDLVALGTVADVGSLRGANRILVRHGLDALRSSTRPGIRAMLRHGEIRTDSISADRISFALGPRLNAAGRVSSPTTALNLLMTEDDDVADDLARTLEQYNVTRRLRTDEILKDVAEQILALPDWKTRPFIAVYGAHWDTGLVGPIASKIVERMGVPAIVMQDQDGTLTGSGRSVHGVNLLDLLHQAAPLMERYGGHSGAAGVTLPKEHFATFTDTIIAGIKHKGLALPYPPVLQLHAWLPEQAQQLSVARTLELMQPYGHGNELPTFGVQNARLIRYRVIGKEQNHLKLTIGTTGREMEALLWGGASRSTELVKARYVHLAGRLGINVFNGTERLQMILDDFRPAD